MDDAGWAGAKVRMKNIKWVNRSRKMTVKQSAEEHIIVVFADSHAGDVLLSNLRASATSVTVN